MLNTHKKIILVLIIGLVLVSGCKEIIKSKTTTTSKPTIILTTTTVSTINIIPKDRKYCDNSTDCIASLRSGCVNAAWFGYKDDWGDKKRTFTCTCYNHICLSEVYED